MKYVAIPESMYKSLIQTQNKEELGTDLAKSELEKVQKSRNKNLSEKNVLYNQELRRYLKTKKEEEEKPVKVELSNGLRGLIKKTQIPTQIPTPTPAGNRPVLRKKPRRRKILLQQPQDFQSPNDTDFAETEIESDDGHASYDYNLGASTSTPKTSDPRYERLVNIISSNPEKYGVDEYNIILNTKSKPTGTDFKTALKHYLQPFGHKYSPGTPGTNILIERLKKDARTNAILKEKPFKTSTPFTRRAKKNQTGTGVIKKNKKHNKSFVKFKPQLWTKN